jgi:hypothetical protein
MPGTIYAIYALLEKTATGDLLYQKIMPKPDGLFTENYVGENTARGDVASLKIHPTENTQRITLNLSNQMNDKLKTLLEDVKKYIEETQVTIDGEWGSCRGLEELKEQGLMPELYTQVNDALAHYSS